MNGNRIRKEFFVFITQNIFWKVLKKNRCLLLVVHDANSIARTLSNFDMEAIESVSATAEQANQFRKFAIQNELD